MVGIRKTLDAGSNSVPPSPPPALAASSQPSSPPGLARGDLAGQAARGALAAATNESLGRSEVPACRRSLTWVGQGPARVSAQGVSCNGFNLRGLRGEEVAWGACRRSPEAGCSSAQSSPSASKFRRLSAVRSVRSSRRTLKLKPLELAGVWLEQLLNVAQDGTSKGEDRARCSLTLPTNSSTKPYIE
jgi:hypothetical protein